MNNIKMPIYYWEDEETKEKHYDLDEMSDELENRIAKQLGISVSIAILELTEEEK